MSDDDLITIGKYTDQIHAEMARVALESHDIPSIVVNESAYQVSARLMVHRGNAEAAMEFLENPDEAFAIEE